VKKSGIPWPLEHFYRCVDINDLLREFPVASFHLQHCFLNEVIPEVRYGANMSLPSINASDPRPNQISLETEQKVADEANAAKDAQQEADDLRQQAEQTDDATERDELLAKADLREQEARSHSKEARQIASSAWQGTVGGAGIGSSVGAGTGAVVGTLVGTIATIPLAGLGALIGLPVGLIHGPFIKMTQGKAQPKEPPSEDEQHRAVIQAVDAVQGGDHQDEGSEDQD
jgi:hypothetical protein